MEHVTSNAPIFQISDNEWADDSIVCLGEIKEYDRAVAVSWPVVSRHLSVIYNGFYYIKCLPQPNLPANFVCKQVGADLLIPSTQISSRLIQYFESHKRA